MGSKDLLQVLLLASVLLFVLLVIIRICKRSNNALVIVEPRKHKYLRAAIENFDKHFDSSWDLYVFHGQHTGEFAAEATDLSNASENTRLMDGRRQAKIGPDVATPLEARRVADGAVAKCVSFDELAPGYAWSAVARTAATSWRGRTYQLSGIASDTLLPSVRL